MNVILHKEKQLSLSLLENLKGWPTAVVWKRSYDSFALVSKAIRLTFVAQAARKEFVYCLLRKKKTERGASAGERESQQTTFDMLLGKQPPPRRAPPVRELSARTHAGVGFLMATQARPQHILLPVADPGLSDNLATVAHDRRPQHWFHTADDHSSSAPSSEAPEEKRATHPISLYFTFLALLYKGWKGWKLHFIIRRTLKGSGRVER